MTTNGDSFDKLTLTNELNPDAFVNIVKYLSANDKLTCSSIVSATWSSLLSPSVGPSLTDPDPQSPSTENLMRSLEVSMFTIIAQNQNLS